MGPIDRTQQSDLTRSCVHQHAAKTPGGWFRIGRRAARAEQLGELSAGRQALEGAAIAPGNMRTLAALTDPSKRPREPRGPLDEDLLTHQPVVPYTMDMKTFLQNVRSSRRGAAPGPSGMTMEHLRPLLESDRDSQLFYEVAVEVSRAVHRTSFGTRSEWGG